MTGFEIVVVGSGVIGSSIAYHLARQGRRVLVIERSRPAVVPALSASVTAASYSPKDGQADPVLTTRALAAAAERHGATFWTDTATLGLRADGSRVTGVQTSREDVSADHVMLAAGAWTDDLV